MFSIEQIVGDVVFFSFKDKERLQEVGLNVESGHFLIKGYDNMGIWVEHPGLILSKTEDSKGRPLPQKKVVKEFLRGDCGLGHERQASLNEEGVFFTGHKNGGERMKV